MKKLSMILTCTALCGAAFAVEPTTPYGIVNFTTCITDSKLGKQEQGTFEALKKQLSSLIEDTEKQLTEISNKMNDAEYMDGLSPEAEDEMKNKFQALNDEMARYQNQYYQVLNQANMRVMQTLATSISAAAERVAKEKKIGMVINKDACFFYSPQNEITTLVIGEMDRLFEQEKKAQAQTQTPVLPASNEQAPVAPEQTK